MMGFLLPYAGDLLLVYLHLCVCVLYACCAHVYVSLWASIVSCAWHDDQFVEPLPWLVGVAVKTWRYTTANLSPVI